MQRLTMQVAARQMLYIAKANYGYAPEVIKSRSRKDIIPRIRQAIGVLLMEHYEDSSLRMIGIELGGKDHSTVHSFKRTHDTDMKFDEVYASIYHRIKSEFEAYTTNELFTLLDEQDRIIAQIMPLQRELAEVTAKIVTLKSQIQ